MAGGDDGAFAGCLRTKGFTLLAPGENEHKNYCPEFGLVLINELKGKTVRVELIGDELPVGTFPTVGICQAPE